MCEASPPSHPRGPCGTLAEAERVVAAARIAALRARLGTDDGGGNADGASPCPSEQPLASSSSSPPLTSSSSSAPAPLLARVHPSVRLFVGGVSSARCLRTLRRNGVTHVVNATTCLPHFHEGRALVEERGAKTRASEDGAKGTPGAATTSPSPSPSSSFSYFRVPIYDDASEDLGPHLECVLAFIDSGLSFSQKGGKGSRRRRQEEEDDDEDSDELDDLDLDFDPDSSASLSPRGGGGVLIHCVGGVSRSAALAAAWLVSRAGATTEGAVAAVKQARPVAAPNSGFVGQLRGLEARVAASKASRHHGSCHGGSSRESDREFSRRLAALLTLPSGSVVVSTTTAVNSTTSRPISVPKDFAKRRSSSTLALSLLPSPVAEEVGIDDSDASAKSTSAAAADSALAEARKEAEARKKMPRATSALLRSETSSKTALEALLCTPLE